jgi:hypothetical protein
MLCAETLRGLAAEIEALGAITPEDLDDRREALALEHKARERDRLGFPDDMF